MIEGIVYRLLTGLAGRDLPDSLPRADVSKRHTRFSTDGTCGKSALADSPVRGRLKVLRKPHARRKSSAT